MPITTSEPPPPKSASRLIGGTGASTFGTEVPQHARDRQVVDVVADVARERAVLAPTGHARVHEPRVAGPARVGPDAEALGDAGPESFEQHVGAFAQPQHHLGAAACFRSTPTLRRPRSITEYGDTIPARDASSPVATSVARSTRSTSAPRSESSMPANCTGPMFGSSTTPDARQRSQRAHAGQSLKPASAFSRRNLGQHVVAERHVGQLGEDAGRMSRPDREVAGEDHLVGAARVREVDDRRSGSASARTRWSSSRGSAT